MQYSYFTHKLEEQYDLTRILLENLPMALLVMFISLAFVYWAVEIYSLVNELTVEREFLRRMAKKTKQKTDSQSIYRIDQINNDQSYVRRSWSHQLSGTNYRRDLFKYSSSNIKEESSLRVDDRASTCIPMSSSYDDEVKDDTVVPIFPELQSGLDHVQMNEVCINISDDP
ncbi:unnamed protein product [Aphis gossypii]|uniref:Uncharacterized protein n=1 Tax=Aphis gossypii TaxID=80765 RepID=A0A9P0IMK3_APHGO|nr:unnamed protein product [Aphis gossypii]